MKDREQLGRIWVPSRVACEAFEKDTGLQNIHLIQMEVDRLVAAHYPHIVLPPVAEIVHRAGKENASRLGLTDKRRRSISLGQLADEKVAAGVLVDAIFLDGALSTGLDRSMLIDLDTFDTIIQVTKRTIAGVKPQDKTVRYPEDLRVSPYSRHFRADLRNQPTITSSFPYAVVRPWLTCTDSSVVRAVTSDPKGPIGQLDYNTMTSITRAVSKSTVSTEAPLHSEWDTFLSYYRG